MRKDKRSNRCSTSKAKRLGLGSPVRSQSISYPHTSRDGVNVGVARRDSESLVVVVKSRNKSKTDDSKLNSTRHLARPTTKAIEDDCHHGDDEYENEDRYGYDGDDDDRRLSLKWYGNQPWISALDVEDFPDEDQEDPVYYTYIHIYIYIYMCICICMYIFVRFLHMQQEERSRVIAFLESLPVKTPKDIITWAPNATSNKANDTQIAKAEKSMHEGATGAKGYPVSNKRDEKEKKKKKKKEEEEEEEEAVMCTEKDNKLPNCNNYVPSLRHKRHDSFTSGKGGGMNVGVVLSSPRSLDEAQRKGKIDRNSTPNGNGSVAHIHVLTEDQESGSESAAAAVTERVQQTKKKAQVERDFRQ
ncbi:calmodulin 4 [Reticulomyxa filosa]|uniref:Calmodulin 4 n=1 Tax=Reticulomyxa filosa TaxID=46433 RepID=X6MIU0_RETFI|nr:calmodulin 4 [Reticulomyxa filosa]|eukprot:ETO13352.1 calmodulin 4 [Reticulomyxa filosa]